MIEVPRLAQASMVRIHFLTVLLELLIWPIRFDLKPKEPEPPAIHHPCPKHTALPYDSTYYHRYYSDLTPTLDSIYLALCIFPLYGSFEYCRYVFFRCSQILMIVVYIFMCQVNFDIRRHRTYLQHHTSIYIQTTFPHFTCCRLRSYR
jgi:uncharacterized membrane protein SirB2